MSSSKYIRYLWLVNLLYRYQPITLNEINKFWIKSYLSSGKEIPLRTFHNHRAAIEDLFGVTIFCDKRTNNYYIKNIENIEQDRIKTWLLNTFALSNLTDESRKLKDRIQVEDIPSGEKYLAPIVQAMENNLKLKITYHSYWNGCATFEIEPYFVKLFKQRWYVIGKSDKKRIYALDRILDLNITDCKFKLPADFETETYFNDCYGVILAEDKKSQIVRIRVEAKQANYIRALPLHHSQKEIDQTDNFSVFEYFIKPTFDFVQELLSQCHYAEVVYPESFRKEIKSIIGKMNLLYD